MDQNLKTECLVNCALDEHIMENSFCIKQVSMVLTSYSGIHFFFHSWRLDLSVAESDIFLCHIERPKCHH
jgi:hypothetical protein